MSIFPVMMTEDGKEVDWHKKTVLSVSNIYREYEALSRNQFSKDETEKIALILMTWYMYYLIYKATKNSSTNMVLGRQIVSLCLDIALPVVLVEYLLYCGADAFAGVWPSGALVVKAALRTVFHAGNIGGTVGACRDTLLRTRR